ncbi:unnamed protein product [Closterium sp. Yama58-4]|nr:unnamed protein product [Closterium sp. Yama58-4]
MERTLAEKRLGENVARLRSGEPLSDSKAKCASAESRHRRVWLLQARPAAITARRMAERNSEAQGRNSCERVQSSKSGNKRISNSPLVGGRHSISYRMNGAGDTRDHLRLPTHEPLRSQIKAACAEDKELIAIVLSAMNQEQIYDVKPVQ